MLRIVTAAEEYNANFRAQRARLDSAREGETIALADLLPQISGSATYPDGKIGGGRESYLISLSQQVLNLAQWRGWRAEERGTDAAVADFSAAQQGLRLTVSAAWLDAQLARETLRLTEARRETVEEQLKRARILEEAGEGTRVDVLSSRARADAVRAEWVSARNNWANARANVARLAGISPAPAALSDSYSPSSPPPLEGWLEKIRGEANELAAARARVERAKMQMDAADSVWVPRVVLSAPLWEETSSGGGGGGGGQQREGGFHDSGGAEFLHGRAGFGGAAADFGAVAGVGGAAAGFGPDLGGERPDFASRGGVGAGAGSGAADGGKVGAGGAGICDNRIFGGGSDCGGCFERGGGAV